MNERIYELAKQAGLLPRHFGPVVETRHTAKKKQDLEKFAELIVREVLDVIENERFEIYPPVVQRVKEHFGVEE